ncbi:hypothetical protein NX059_007848 [Plenodomus lindquistii]|nr:hypothetical protein NX059_007848 [Plenodomus lindquistii]
MQFIVALAALLSTASAAAITARQSGVCGPLATPSCCQLDLLGVANLNCENAGVVATTEEFEAVCAETGTSAQCCVLPLGADALLCTGA